MADRLIPDRAYTKVTRGSDRNAYNFPRPIVAVDTALLTLDPEQGLVVVEMARDDIDAGKWALPGAFLRKGEILAEAVERSLRDKVGVQGIKPIQLYVFDDPERDNRNWVLSVAHVAVVRPEQLQELGSGTATAVRLAPVDRPGELVWDHPAIVKRAKQHIRSRYEDKPDPDRLLGNRFTMRELQLAHEAVAGHPLQRDKFRRTMEPQLIGTGNYENTGTRGRPAEFFRRKP